MRELLIAPRLGFQVAVLIGLLYAGYWFWPGSYAQWFFYIPPGLIGIIAVRRSYPALLELLKYHDQASRKHHSRNPRPNPDDARFATEQEMEKAGLFDPNLGVPVGIINGRPFFFPFTHSFLVAPAGSAKTVAAAQPALIHGYRVPGNRKGRSTPASAIVLDLKRELSAMGRRARSGLHHQKVIVLDPAAEDTAAYNFVDLVIDAVKAVIPPEKAITLAAMIALALEPEPADDGKNRYWRQGSRDLITVAILYLAVHYPEFATLTEVSRTIRDPDALKDVLANAAASDALAGELAVMARDALQSAHFDQFRTGASVAMTPFTAAGELTRVVGRSTFRWADLKREGITVFVCANLAESKIFGPWLRLIAECATMELEYARGNVPVHLLLDEATNVAFDISSKLTALRGSGLRVQFICQELAEVERVFGKHAAETIVGESNLRQFFAVSDHMLAVRLSEALGTREVVKESYSRGEDPWSAYNQSAAYHRKPLLSATEILHMPLEDQLVFIKGTKRPLRPIYCQKLPYDAVKEWIGWLDDNPVEGGKLQGPPTIRMKYGSKGVRVTRYKRINQNLMRRIKRSLSPLLPPLWAGFAALWLSLAYYGWYYVVPQVIPEGFADILKAYPFTW